MGFPSSRWNTESPAYLRGIETCPSRLQTDVCDRSPAYLRGIETQRAVGAPGHAVHRQPTYEGLKLAYTTPAQVKAEHRQPTYEGLKLEIELDGAHRQEVSPAYLRGIETAPEGPRPLRRGVYRQPTYEGLKLRSAPPATA
mgnify:CR=1 FL=1